MSLNYASEQQQSSDVKKRRELTSTHPVGKSLTKQADTAACNIDNILSQYRKTGLINHLNEHEGRYQNVSTCEDFQTAMNIVCKAEESFQNLPSEIRQDFRNDPAEFLKFVAEPENHDALVKYGLAVPHEHDEETGEIIEPKSDPKPEPKSEEKNPPKGE